MGELCAQSGAEVKKNPEWVFELKYDGFRSLAVIQNGRCQLISRNGHSFNSYAELRQSIPSELPHEGQTVLDGEIVCLDKRGRPQFRDLLFHRAEPYFFAFDLLMSDGMRTARHARRVSVPHPRLAINWNKKAELNTAAVYS